MFSRTVFVLAPSFHGATLLSKLLNAHPEITALGDTYPTNAYDQLCGCERRVSRCEFWGAIKRDVSAKQFKSSRFMLPLVPGENGGLVDRILFSDFTSFWASPRYFEARHSDSTLRSFRQCYRSFLEAVHQHDPQPGTIFVDGVKYVSRVSALAAAGVQIDGVIHLTRDPEDFVRSSLRNAGQSGGLRTFEHALRYRLYHARARQISSRFPHLEICYEQLAEDVDGQLARLFGFLGVAQVSLEALQSLDDSPWHFMGNSTLRDFDGTIRRSRGGEDRSTVRWLRWVAGR